ncbi:RHS repeat domain-containing protein [Desulfonema ishimotonii]|nr:RHS repeat-associated core domain-containing protein [Desulfonema ishimotonii]
MTEHTGRVVTYDYDDLYRLTEEEITDPANGNETISYTYDDFGNRLTKTDASGTTGYHYDGNDRLYQEDRPDGTTVSYGYDDNGNTLTKGDGTYTTVYSWDAENRLISVDDGVSVAEYEYDADGIRVSAETDGNVTEYLVDKNRDYAQVLEERDADGNLIVGYVYGDDLIRQVRGGVLSYYQYDGQLSVRQLTDTDGNISDDYVYDAFGVLLEQSDDTVNDYLYTGEQFDSDAGFYYLRARYYSPDGGRFVSSDPWQGTINKPLSLNKYLYCYANPVMNVDPSGKMGLGYIAATLGVHENLQKINTSHKLRQYRQACANLCSIAAKFAKSGNKTYEDVKKILGGKSRFQSHHVFQHAVMRGKKNYRYAIGFAIPLLTKVYGKKSFPSPHYASTEIQKLGGKKRNSRFIAYAALIAAGCRKKDATEITLAAENYNEMMGW